LHDDDDDDDDDEEEDDEDDRAIPRSSYYIPLSCGGASHFRRRLSAKRMAGGRARKGEEKGERK
jgi:hypothetical protein